MQPNSFILIFSWTIIFVWYPFVNFISFHKKQVGQTFQFGDFHPKTYLLDGTKLVNIKLGWKGRGTIGLMKKQLVTTEVFIYWVLHIIDRRERKRIDETYMSTSTFFSFKKVELAELLSSSHVA